MNGCKKCPAFAKCTATYRGSACAALRYTYGLENDPKLDCTDREKLIELLYSADIPHFVKRRTRRGTTTVEDIADHLLAHGVTFAKDTDVPSKWISVEDEEKPKHLREYFITYKFGDSDMRFYGAEKYYAFGGNGYVDLPHFAHEGTYCMHVTHWMEIPKLTKEE